jgi:uncharacterized protein (DUF58 family)
MSADRPSDPPLLDAPPAEILRRLQLTVRRRLDGMLQGDYQGMIPGHGSEPGECRLYEAGDDVRRIDWNVTARTQQTHLRQAVADRELELTLVMDLTASLSFGTALRTKRELAVSAAAAVALLAGRAGNRVAGVLATGDGVAVLPPRPGRDALLALLHRIVVTSTPDGTGTTGDLQSALQAVVRSRHRRGMVVVVSDFLDAPVDAWVRPLRIMNSRHDVLAIEVVDPRELTLPDVGLIDLVDPETGRQRLVDTSSAALRTRFEEAATAQRQAIATALRSTGTSHLQLRTDRDWLVDLARFLGNRRRVAAGFASSTSAPGTRRSGAVPA